jgi:hypothetical protein
MPSAARSCSVRQRDLDFAAAVILDHDEGYLALAAGLEMASTHEFSGLASRTIDPERRLAACGTILERFGGLDAQADTLGTLLRIDGDDDRLAGLQQFTVDAPGLRKTDTASYCPELSEKATMPILLPVRVLRSCLLVTVPASRPAVAPALTDNLRNPPRSARASWRADPIIGIERMRGEIKAQRLVFAVQLFGRQPGRGRGQMDGLGLSATAANAPNMSL